MRTSALPVVLSAVLLLAGCTSAPSAEVAAGTSGDAAVPAEVRTAPPGEPLTVVADPGAVEAAASASRALFARAEVAVVARDGDAAGVLLGASAAAGLGVPLLLEPGDGTPAAALAEELDRLGTTTVLAVGGAKGDAPAGGAPADGAAEDGVSGAAAPDGTPSTSGARDGEGPEEVAVPADPGAVAAATGLDWADVVEVPDGGAAAAVAALDADDPVALRPAGAGAPASGDGTGEARVLPGVTRTEPRAGTLLLATGGAETVAGVATARAAGARVQVTGGATDPRGVPDVVAAMGEDPPESVVVLGAGFAAEDGLDWKLATAVTGTQLPAGGQLLFPASFLVALYGTPGSGALGVLGEQDLPASIERARAHAADYEPLVDATVVPAFEIIATVASAAAGPDGDYSAESEVEALRPWVEGAGEAGLYVVLDLQPGRTDFVTQAERYRPLLELPHVGLALDPEWRLGPDQVHLRQIGSVGIDEVNRVVTWLADLTRGNRLPQKLLVLHQFQVRMIPGRDRLDTSRDELALVVHVDGQGTQPAKQETWRTLRGIGPEGIAWGWKNFYDEDRPVLTPQQTVEQVAPLPQLVTYQ
ncbi:hypothetical protein OF117_16380 [Geodermatophilus sp. YIM 151500]|uniref:hypothetical protein n=1 Tax=Geodermatophilus sp. YIM 151500 TaxID=2984531 RepID=UPI0021E367BB|nr:hypothetical protein [Geodermatophilus sp. YIM 151500]MCV2490933.1 hypothetical protein [Geodermatophilus sp. YIM 151500]